MKITASQLKTIIKEELANVAGQGMSSPHGSGYEMAEEEEKEPTLSDADPRSDHRHTSPGGRSSRLRSY